MALTAADWVNLDYRQTSEQFLYKIIHKLFTRKLAPPLDSAKAGSIIIIEQRNATKAL